MNIYRYKNYDFEKGILPIGKEWKTPEVYALEAPGSDYEIVQDEAYLIEFIKEKYKINGDSGKDYVLTITAKLNLYIQSGIVTVEEAEDYANNTENVIRELNRGYWHSAYFYLISYVPIEKFSILHLDIKEVIKSYVNDKYPPVFKIE